VQEPFVRKLQEKEVVCRFFSFECTDLLQFVRAGYEISR
jgi:hypothetical protein